MGTIQVGTCHVAILALVFVFYFLFLDKSAVFYTQLIVRKEF
jgi:hypothetical protein